MKTLEAKVLERLAKVREALMLADPDGVRLKTFGDHVPEDAEVKDLCERHGYGAVIDSAARQWRKKDDVGSFAVGPCVVTLQQAVKALDEAIALMERA